MLDKTQTVFKELLKKSEWASKLDTINCVKEIVTANKLDNIIGVLDKINRGEIDYFQTIEITGRIFNYGYFAEPDTYIDSQWRYQQFNVKERRHEFNVKALFLPLLYSYEKMSDKSLAFLYKDDVDPFYFESSNTGIEVSENNCFIPIVIDSQKQYDLLGKRVRVIAKLLPFNDLEILQLTRYSTHAYQQVVKEFFDYRYPEKQTVLLDSDNITVLEDIDLYIPKGKRVFCVEYEVENDNISSKNILDKLSLAVKKKTNTLPFLPGEVGPKQIVRLVADSDYELAIHYANRKIGFYKEIDLEDILGYGLEMEQFKNMIVEIMNSVKLRVSISFISDGRKKNFFEIL